MPEPETITSQTNDDPVSFETDSLENPETDKEVSFQGPNNTVTENSNDDNPQSPDPEATGNLNDRSSLQSPPYLVGENNPTRRLFCHSTPLCNSASTSRATLVTDEPDLSNVRVPESVTVSDTPPSPATVSYSFPNPDKNFDEDSALAPPQTDPESALTSRTVTQRPDQETADRARTESVNENPDNENVEQKGNNGTGEAEEPSDSCKDGEHVQKDTTNPLPSRSLRPRDSLKRPARYC